jgi:PPM family protein phosphatase
MARDILIRAAGESDPGQARPANQDAFGFDLDRGLFVVCDGVGGERAGAVASRMAADCLLDCFPVCRDRNAGAATLHRVIHQIHRKLREAGAAEPAYAGMSTTIVSAYFDGQRMWIAHVGDSRAYLLRNNSLHRLSDDHSVLSQRLRNGDHRTNPAEARRLRGMLTQALGSGDLVVPDVTTLQVSPGDRFLLATDGLTSPLSHPEILSLMVASLSPQHACRQLVAAANAAGGYDNITCIVVEID